MYEIKPMGRGKVYARRPFGGFPPGFGPILAILGFVVLASSGSYFPFFPLVLLLFVFFVAPALGRTVLHGTAEPLGTSEVRPAADSHEKELLRALERHEEITAARAALETSLSVTEAEGMLAKLASGGHVEVRAQDGTLAYALHAADRRKAVPKEIAQNGHEPIE
jgi:hypothetical protein